MSAARSRPRRKAPPPAKPKQGEIRKPYPVWFVTAAAFVLPGSGQMLNGNAIRGIVMQFFMVLLGFITYKVSSPDISLIGRFAGGIFVYVMSVIDANTVAKRRMAAWERMGESGGGPEGVSRGRPVGAQQGSRAAKRRQTVAAPHPGGG